MYSIKLGVMPPALSKALTAVSDESGLVKVHATWTANNLKATKAQYTACWGRLVAAGLTSKSVATITSTPAHASEHARTRICETHPGGGEHATEVHEDTYKRYIHCDLSIENVKEEGERNVQEALTRKRTPC
jgi:hypothetical protein